MGLLRLYLALCVLAAHSNNLLPWGMHTGPDAVLIFFIISGFYMEMVVSSRYNCKRDFYLSRFLRIYPTYGVVLLGVICISIVFGLLFGNWLNLSAYVNDPLKHVGPAGLLFTALTNISIFGQDWVMFLSDPGTGLRITKDFTTDSHPLHHFLLIPPVWSIGLELTFYLVVPFLNRLRTKWLLVVAGISITLKLVASIKFGLTHDPWSYRFFPFELSLFIFGMLGHRLYRSAIFQRLLERIKPVNNITYWIASPALLLILNILTRLNFRIGKMFDEDIVLLIFCALWMVWLPLLFHVFKNQKVDRFIGELSYPVYLIHVVILSSLEVFQDHFHLDFNRGWIAALISVALSVVVYLFIIAPLDKRRHILAHSKPEKT